LTRYIFPGNSPGGSNSNEEPEIEGTRGKRGSKNGNALGTKEEKKSSFSHPWLDLGKAISQGY